MTTESNKKLYGTLRFDKIDPNVRGDFGVNVPVEYHEVEISLMSVNTFVGQEIVLLRQFADYWSEHTKADPESYPEKLEPGDWMESYLLWSDGK